MAEPRLYFHHLINSTQIETQSEQQFPTFSLQEFEIQSSTLTLNYRALDPAASRLLRLLGLLAGDRFTTSLATSLLESNAESAIAQLITFQFIQRLASGYYQLAHPAIRSLARHQVGLEETIVDRQSARLRICHWYLSQLESNAPKASAWFEQERLNLFAAIDWSQQTQNWETFVRLIETMAEFLDDCRDYALGQQLSRLALRSINAPIHEAIVLNNLGNFDLRQQLWESAESNYEKSFTIFTRLDDSFRAAQTSVNLGILAIQQDQPTTAIKHWKTAIVLSSDTPEHQAIKERMFSIDSNVFESAGGTLSPAPGTNRLFQTFTEKLKRFLID